MCGIVGYIGSRQATPLLLAGLARLEYRGYDSAGVAVWSGGQTQVVRCRGKLRNLLERIEREPVAGSLGIGHTRWATHGGPSDENAHPHRVGPISVVHNGIFENHLALRQELMAAGAVFSSETDTEIVAHLIARARAAGAESLVAAVRQSLAKIRGAYALVVMDETDPTTLVCAKSASPLIVGLGEHENFIASDVTAVLSETRSILFLEEDEVAVVTATGVLLMDLEGNPKVRQPKTITWSAMQAEKSGFKHFMLKEIHEQPRAVADTLVGRIDLEHSTARLDDVALDPHAFDRIVFVACGTSYHASLVGEFMIEGIARIPVEVELASEFRYRDPLVSSRDLVIAVSQSGETADTMAALREAKSRGAKTLAICNVVESSIARLADQVFYTHAGPEIGVASTKAFTTQLVSMFLLAVYLGRTSGRLPAEQAAPLLSALTELPAKMTEVIEHGAQLQSLARRYGQARGFLFLGRGALFPIALEGALKLKEISYIHAEGYAAGEMKHGPIALIDEHLPVVVLALQGPYYDKVVSNLVEVRARQGRVIAIATRGDSDIGHVAEDVVLVPDTALPLQPILGVLPLQMLSYFVADFKGTDIDQPRNLAKSVTVE